MHRLVNHWDGLLTNNLQAALFQFMRQHGFINRFQQPRPKGRVNFERGIHHLLGNFIFSHKIFAPLRLCVRFLFQAARLAGALQNGLRQRARLRCAGGEDAVDVIQIGGELGALFSSVCEMVPVMLEQTFLQITVA